jgi:Putative prokaryotic signal transducing protein
MITVATCSNPAEAELLHSLLTDHGIRAFVLDDAFGGAIRLQVDEEQAADARRILEQAAQASSADEADDPEGRA